MPMTPMNTSGSHAIYTHTSTAGRRPRALRQCQIYIVEIRVTVQYRFFITLFLFIHVNINMTQATQDPSIALECFSYLQEGSSSLITFTDSALKRITNITSQAIKLEAVQPFLLLQSGLDVDNTLILHPKKMVVELEVPWELVFHLPEDCGTFTACQR